ncbi:RNase P subunit p30-domain-containing protein [Radiomyces spectabilis]|uniref:RNase P subunit p30-domain-containing protein n=1 Tax=Radiomyces spectabilis TaxID=64574 RepID=UPI00221F4AA7|nr:RNase P subunit p30-domain-containing protein [Radiomyces spectabilis]KAI8379191.1 RNase P subunit p30-domain-containing protein [Radiomyces spectabilis]
MLYDFNIPYPTQPERADFDRLESILGRISSIEKGTIALNKTIRESLSPKITRIEPIAPEKFKNLQQLTRITVVAEDTKRNYQLTGSFSQIDILAVQPINIDVCKHACQTYDVDLITLDFSYRWISPGYVAAQVAVNRGVFFEICYSQITRMDEKKRAVFFGNFRRLVEVTRGQNIILSSEAIKALDIRRPSELRMLCILCGMTQAQVEASLGYNYLRLLKKAETRKYTYCAAVRVDAIPESNKRKDDEPVTPKKKAKTAAA